MAVYDLLFRNGCVVNQDGIGVRDIAVHKGRIAHIGSVATDQADKVIDCTGLHILPGVIDSQVHFREPGAIHKEDLETGSRAAVLGGVTSVFEMPNTNPLTTNAEALSDKLQRAHHRMHCDFAFWVGGTRENVHEVDELEHLPGAAGIKIFMGSSTGPLLLCEDKAIREILRRTRRRVAFHAEEEARLEDRKHLREKGNPASHPIWRDEQAALRATEQLIKMVEETRAKIHILHISTAQEIEMLAHHKDYITCEVTPQHLTFSSHDYARLGTYLQMNPPIRAHTHQSRLWWGLEQGIVDVLGSDHAPHTIEEKERPYPESPSGMTGVQTFVPIMLHHVSKGRLSLERFVDLTSAGPARIFGIARKGRIALGYDADLTLVDLSHRKVIQNEWIASRSRWTPYAGYEVTGWPIGTIIRGQQVMWEGELLTPHIGEPVLFV